MNEYISEYFTVTSVSLAIIIISYTTISPVVGTVTSVSLAIIIIIFFLFIYQACKLRILSNIIKKANKNDDVLLAFTSTKLAEITGSYKQSMNIETPQGVKTNIAASAYFSEFNVSKAQHLNIRILDTAAGTLVGLGLLGTFLGLTLGIQGFDSSNTVKIQESIQGLLSGMGTAFLTSLVGMGLSLLYTVFDKYWRGCLSKHLFDLTEKLDNAYYIDDTTLATLNQEKLLNALYRNIKNVIEEQVNSVNNKLIYTNEQGTQVTLGNAIREILTENQQQSTALKSFSTDLAIQLSQDFDQVLSNQMQEKLVPLMQNVDNTTKLIVEHIDKMADQVAAPATDMIQNVVNELKNSMSSIIAEFNKGLSGSATNELENLASQLGTAAQAMADFPVNMENITATLNDTIIEVKSAVTEISNTSANANSTAMQNMQEQISFATTAISNAINEVKDVMNGITNSSKTQSDEMVSKLQQAAENLGTFLSRTISSLSSSVQESVKGITNDVNDKQADLIALQEDTTTQTRKLLETFNDSLDKLNKMNESISRTMNAFNQAQGQITGSTAHLQNISGNMQIATQTFRDSQQNYTTKMEELQKKSQTSINAVSNLLSQTGEMSNEYVQKFDVIKQGIGNVFSQLQNGLSQYSRTVQASTQTYLTTYSNNLTRVTDTLSSIIAQQNELLEALLESINTLKK